MKKLKIFTLEFFNEKENMWIPLDQSIIQYTDLVGDGEREYTFFDFFNQKAYGIGIHHWEHCISDIHYTLFKRKKQLYIYGKKHTYILEEKKCKTIKFRDREETLNWSLKTLIEELSNEDFLEYLHDKGYHEIKN
jgi:hypothetical protein